MEAKPSRRWETKEEKVFDDETRQTHRANQVSSNCTTHYTHIITFIYHGIEKITLYFVLSLCGLCHHHTCALLFLLSLSFPLAGAFHSSSSLCVPFASIACVPHREKSKRRFNSCRNQSKRPFLYPSMNVLSINRMINLQVNRLKSQAEHSIFEPIQSLTINA